MWQRNQQAGHNATRRAHKGGRMNVRVKKSDPPETTEILADAIVRISDALTQLKESGLNRAAIVILIRSKTHLPKRDIEAVLDAQARLASWYCRKK